MLLRQQAQRARAAVDDACELAVERCRLQGSAAGRRCYRFDDLFRLGAQQAAHGVDQPTTSAQLTGGAEHQLDLERRQTGHIGGGKARRDLRAPAKSACATAWCIDQHTVVEGGHITASAGPIDGVNVSNGVSVWARAQSPQLARIHIGGVDCAIIAYLLCKQQRLAATAGSGVEHDLA